MSQRILFVCTGNTCRSPMAEGLARKLMPQGRYASAGVSAWPGQPASKHAQEALSRVDIDLSGHSSRRVSEELLKSADLVLCMTGGHLSALLQSFPQFKQKTHVLRDFVGLQPVDVTDPYGGSLADYEQCAGQLAEAIYRLESLALVDK